MNRRAIDLLALTFALLSLGCLIVAFARRHSLSDLPDFEGAYFNRSVGSPKFASVLSGNQFEPFHPFHAYLWLGAGIGFAIAAMTIFVTARLVSR